MQAMAAAAPAAAATATATTAAAKPAAEAGKSDAKAAPKIKTHSIDMTVGFQCTTRLMYEALTDERIVSTYHQSKATIDAKAGGNFVLFEGTIRGQFVELVPGSRIVQKWRFNEWPDEHYSVVTISLNQKSSGVVELKLVQTGIPEEDKYGNRDIAAKVKKGWSDFFWVRINKIVGYLPADLGKADSDDD